MKQITIKALASLIIFQLLSLGFSQAVYASLTASQAMITETSSTAINSEQKQIIKQRLTERLINLGVADDYAQQRINNLTDEELVQLDTKFSELPAGQGAFAVIGVVFVVLLLLEVFGITNLFNKV